MDLDDFLVKAYAKQIKELNSSTGKKSSRCTFTEQKLTNIFISHISNTIDHLFYFCCFCTLYYILNKEIFSLFHIFFKYFYAKFHSLNNSQQISCVCYLLKKIKIKKSFCTTTTIVGEEFL